MNAFTEPRSIGLVGARLLRPHVKNGTVRQHSCIRAVSSASQLIQQHGSQEALHIQLDGFKLLQVNRATSPGMCARAFDRLVNSPPGGFNQDTLAARAAALKGVMDQARVIAKTSRPSYQAQSGQIALTLHPDDLPGALALLQEAGEAQAVLQMGGSALESGTLPALDAREVALAVALAHCDEAAVVMDHGDAAALTAVQHMQQAVDLLHHHQTGGSLQQDISQALQELGPKAALRQLALPLGGDMAAERAQGLRQVHSIVCGQDAMLGSIGVQLLQEARTHMTAAEQIRLYEDRPQRLLWPGEELYEVGLAYMAEGWATYQPKHIRNALDIFGQLKSSAGSPDMSVEVAVCRLLLGSSDQAEDALGLSEGSTREADPAVRQYVEKASGGSVDLLPGICALAQQWLGDVALPGFRGMPASAGSLNAWFTNRQVVEQLKVAMPAPTPAGPDAPDRVLATTQEAVSAPLPAGSESGRSAASGKWQDGAAGTPAASTAPVAECLGRDLQPGLGAAKGSTMSQRGGWQGEVTPRVLMLRPFGNEKAHRLQQAAVMERPGTTVDRAAADVVQDRRPAQAWPQSVVEEADMDTSSEISLTALSRSSQRPLMRGAAPVAVGEDITAGIINFEGEREMWASFDEAAANQRKLVRFCLGISLLVAAAAAAASTRMRADRPYAPTAVPAMMQAQNSQLRSSG
eukprot:jgi/Astpho2/1556/fgenesh1_pg.00026_%23_38_t